MSTCFLGLISTQADVGASDRLSIVGPVNTKHFVASMRPFLHRANYCVSIDEMDAERPEYGDKRLAVRTIEVFPSIAPNGSPRTKRVKSCEGALAVENLDVGPDVKESHHFLLKMFKDPSAYGSDVAEETLACPDHYRREETDRMASSAPARLPSATPRHSSLVYFVRGPEQPGKFNAAKAKELGVKPGPLNGRLAKGETIVLPDGTQVTPEMCVGPTTPGPVFAYLDLPTPDHQQSFMSRQAEYSEYLEGGQLAAQLQLVIHYYGGGHCAQITEGLSWPKHVKHLFIAKDSKHISLLSSFEMQEKLSAAFNFDQFPLPCAQALDPQFCKPLARLEWLPVIPDLGIDESGTICRPSSPPNSHNEWKALAENRVPDLLTTVLGTGAAMPGKYRNVSSTLLSFNADGGQRVESLLLDCGEGTIGQLYRAFGEAYVDVLRSVHVVFISHLHADHHAGLAGFLRVRQQLRITWPITIVGPTRYLLWLQEYSECSPLPKYEFISAEDLLLRPRSFSSIAKFECVPVEHCPRSYACRFETATGLKVLFSGDTRPCESVTKAGNGVDLLIHEATMGDDLQDEAIAKRHSTISEAIEVGCRMAAKHVLLTHFSQRYAKCAPPITKDAHNVAVAFDLMQIPLSRFHEIEGWAYNQQLRAVLPEDPPAED